VKVNRRNFLVGTAAATAAAALPVTAQSGQDSTAGKRKPNIVIYHSDQFRWDFLGANGLNSSTDVYKRQPRSSGESGSSRKNKRNGSAALQNWTA